MKVYQLTYRSEAIQEITANNIYEIVIVAKEFNSSVDITGCIIFDNGYFVQILEGKKEHVEELYNKIKKDKRHTFPDILSKGWAPKRIFENWDMAYMNLTDLTTGNKKDLVLKAQTELQNISTKINFTTKVFWYNIKELLSEDGYYKSTASNK